MLLNNRTHCSALVYEGGPCLCSDCITFTMASKVHT